MRARPALLGLSLAIVAACTAAEPLPEVPPAPAAAPASSVATEAKPASACPGRVEAREELREIRDDALLKQAIGAPGEGNLCTGKVFEVVRPMTVYRVWNKAKAETRIGRWWSLSPLKGLVADYRAAFAICPEWSPLDAAVACRIKVGTRVVVGPGQSATCAKGSYPASATNQVFVPNEASITDPASPRLLVEGCTDVAWP
ncbi:MAG: hypothetical protein QM820_46195 [Minicystis sp.]